MEAFYKKLTIRQIQEEVAGVKTITFEPDDANRISYEPGQYLTLVRYTPTGEIRRSYSITSAPVLAETLTIGVKRIANGVFSRYLVDYAQPGTVLYTTGAAGFFTLPPDLLAYKQFVFCAAGSGITPIYSLLKTVLHAYPAIQILLVYSNRSEEETIFRESLIRMEQQFADRFKVEFLYSNAVNLNQARLHKALLQSFLRQYVVAPLTLTLCYICGPLNYMRMCTYGLREAGIPAGNIRKENFSTEKVSSPVLPPDTAPHAVIISYGAQTRYLQVQYPKTILQAAREVGIALPYSCEAGRCGNCVAMCTRGKVWLSNNEVLTEKELTKGLTLTCVGYPVEGEVHLVI